MASPLPGPDTRRGLLGLPFHEATIEADGHPVALVFSDLVVDVLEPGYAPFVVTE